jgi:hypothetical protein
MENFFFSMSYRFQNTYAYALCKHCEALLKKFRVKILVLGSLYESVIKFVNTKINPFWSSILLLTINFDTILLHNKFTVLWSGGHWWGHNRKQTDPAHQCCGTKSIEHLKEKKGYRIFLRWKTFISMPYRFQNIYSSIERHCLKKFWVKILVLGSVSESVIKFVNPKINPFRRQYCCSPSVLIHSFYTTNLSYYDQEVIGEAVVVNRQSLSSKWLSTPNNVYQQCTVYWTTFLGIWFRNRICFPISGAKSGRKGPHSNTKVRTGFDGFHRIKNTE